MDAERSREQPLIVALVVTLGLAATWQTVSVFELDTAQPKSERGLPPVGPFVNRPRAAPPRVRSEVPAWLRPCARDPRGFALGTAKPEMVPGWNFVNSPIGELVGVALSTGTVCHSSRRIVGEPFIEDHLGVCVEFADDESMRVCDVLGVGIVPQHLRPSVSRALTGERRWARVLSYGSGGVCVVRRGSDAAQDDAEGRRSTVVVSGCGPNARVWSPRASAGAQWLDEVLFTRDASVVGLVQSETEFNEVRRNAFVLFEGASGRFIAIAEAVTAKLVCDPDCWPPTDR